MILISYVSPHDFFDNMTDRDVSNSMDMKNSIKTNNRPGRHSHDITDLPEFFCVKHRVFLPHGFGSQGFSFCP